MGFCRIDYDAWPRRPYFEHYHRDVPCWYSMTADVDITALLLRFFIQSVRQALRIAVSFLILQKNSICISVDRQKSDPVTHRECLLAAETVIDQHGPRSPGSRCAQYGIPAGRNAVAGILHRHTAAPVLLKIRQRYTCFHSARIPLVCLK